LLQSSTYFFTSAKIMYQLETNIVGQFTALSVLSLSSRNKIVQQALRCGLLWAKVLHVNRIFFLVAVFLLSGCASQLAVTYYSDPPGAVLYTSGQIVGYTPKVLFYTIPEEAKKSGFVNLAATKVQWASGASAELKLLKADLAKYGLNQQFTFNRPDSFPGREADMRFSLELDRTRSILRQAAAQEEQAAAQRRIAAAQEEQALAERYRVTRPTRCTSTLIGNVVNTSCY
jgi:hypothetical protein